MNKTYKDLEVYKLSFELFVCTHRFSFKMPKHEIYELGSQIRRSADSVNSNIVEGYGRRRYKKDFVKFLIYSHSSNDETINHFRKIIEVYPNLIKEGTELIKQYDILGAKLNKFIQYVEKNWNTKPATRIVKPAKPATLMQLHLNTYGAYLHVKDQLFEVKLKEEKEYKKHHVAASKVKSIWMAKGTALSTDAVHLAIKNNIDIVFLEYDGFPIGRVWHSKLGSTSLIRKKQLEASLGPLALHYTQQWLHRKLNNQAEFIRQLKKHRTQNHDFLTDKIERIEKLRDNISHLQKKDINEVADKLRGWEGTAGRLFFETISKVIPPQYQFSGRSFRPAKDVFNAFLNYSYGLLYSRVEKSLILAGLDPYVGFLHRDDYNYKSMVYDFIEPYRVFSDKVVFTLFAAKKIRQDFSEEIQNGIRIHKEGKVMLVEAFNKYFEEDRVRYKGKNQTRMNIIQSEAHQFANELIKKQDPI